jgi:O-antigen/teichoic acid export membrane protein
MLDAVDPEQLPVLPREEVFRRGREALVLVAVRGLATRVIGAVGFVVLAGLLGPSDFGLLALGLTFLTLAGFLSDFGVAAALLRGPETPSREVLAAMLGFQLTISSSIVACAIGGALVLGEGAIVTAIMVASLPLYVLRGPPSLMLERQLRYREIATADIVETCLYVALSIAAVLGGAGVEGVAIAFFVKPLAGDWLLIRAGGMGFIRPRWRPSLVRPMLAFGWRLGANHFVLLGRDQAFVLGATVLGGLTGLGLWNLVIRLMIIPSVLLEAVARVSFPTISRLIDAGSDPREPVRSAIGLATAVLGFVLAAIVAAGPNLLPAMIGTAWRPSADILRWFCLGVLIGAPLVTVATAYLLAIGDASTPLRIASADAGVAVVVGVALLPVVGAEGLGIGVTAGACVSAVLLNRALAERLEMAAPVLLMLKPAVLSAAMGAGGWVLATALPTSILAGAAAVAATMVAHAVVFALFLPRLLAAVRRSLRDMLTAVRRRPVVDAP